MTWTVNLSGHDDLSGDEKEQLENELVQDVKNFVDDLQTKEGIRVTMANVTTNTTGTVNALSQPA